MKHIEHLVNLVFLILASNKVKRGLTTRPHKKICPCISYNQIRGKKVSWTKKRLNNMPFIIITKKMKSIFSAKSFWLKSSCMYRLWVWISSFYPLQCVKICDALLSLHYFLIVKYIQVVVSNNSTHSCWTFLCKLCLCMKLYIHKLVLCFHIYVFLFK